MKKYLVIIIAILCIGVASAATYDLTADKLSPGVFDGNYYYPDTLIVGSDSASTSTSTAIYLSDDSGYTRGIYYYGDGFQFPIVATSTDSTQNNYAIYGYARNGFGVYGGVGSDDASDAAVKAYAGGEAPGVLAYSEKYGVYVDASGSNKPTYGLYVENADSYGIYVADSDTNGIRAYSDSTGGYFDGDTYGIKALSDSKAGYFSGDDYGIIVYGGSYGSSFYGDTDGIYASSSSTSSKQCGVEAYNSASGNSAYLGCYNNGIYTPDSASVGSCSGCDIAEHFIDLEELEPGDVVVMDTEAVRGVRKTDEAYSKLGAGIVSTDPTITMGLDNGVPIALSGVVPTKVVGKIEVGDLLVTSTTAGHAMACDDYEKCQGAIIGKSMEAHDGERGTVIALVMLG